MLGGMRGMLPGAVSPPAHPCTLHVLPSLLCTKDRKGLLEHSFHHTQGLPLFCDL